MLTLSAVRIKPLAISHQRPAKEEPVGCLLRAESRRLTACDAESRLLGAFFVIL